MNYLLRDFLEDFPDNLPVFLNGGYYDGIQVLNGILMDSTFLGRDYKLAYLPDDGGPCVLWDKDLEMYTDEDCDPPVIVPINMIELSPSTRLYRNNFTNGYHDRPIAINSGAITFFNELTLLTKESFSVRRVSWSWDAHSFIEKPRGRKVIVIEV